MKSATQTPLSGRRLLTGLLGAPIAHSASPAMHERARLYRQYLQAAISFLSKEPPEVRERWQWLVGMEEFIRDVENTHEERRQP